MEDFAIFSVIIGIVIIVVFFVMASNINRMKKELINIRMLLSAQNRAQSQPKTNKNAEQKEETKVEP